MSSNLEFDMRPDTFGRVAVKKLSTQRTSSPRASSRSHRWEPMNPAPPVTRTRRLPNICLPHHSQELYNVLASARPVKLDAPSIPGAREMLNRMKCYDKIALWSDKIVL